MKPKGLGRGLSALLPDADFEEPTGAGLQTIPVRQIKPNPRQPRRDFNPAMLDELTKSIAAKGVIQPLVVRKSRIGFEIVAGERRLRAAKKAGLKEVPCRVMEISDDVEMLELSLIENLQRDDLNAVELAEGYRQLVDDFNLTQVQISVRVGKDRATVANTLRLLDLPDPIKRSLRNGEISAGHAKALLSVGGKALRSAIWKRILAEGLSVRQTEELAKIAGGRRKPDKKRQKEPTPVIRGYIDRLRRALGTQVHIQLKGKKGVIRVEFYNEEDLTRIVEYLTEDRPQL